MKGMQIMLAAAVLALGSAPAFAQGNVQGQAQAGAGERMDMADMVCTMGMLPHAGMGGGMMGGQGMMGGMMGGMQPGAQAGGMQHKMPGMQPGAMGAARSDSTAKAGAAGGMQPGMMGGMQRGGAGQGMGGMDMMAMAHPVTPTMLIHHAKDLGLTEDQQEKVTQLAKTSQASCEQHMQAALASHQAAAALLDRASPDVAGYQARLNEAAGHMIEGHVAVIKAGIEAEALLTPAQREKLKATASTMHGGK